MKLFTILLFTVLITNQLNAQGSTKSWAIGVGLTAIDDDGRDVKSPKNMFNGFNMLPFPSSINFEYYFNKNVSLELCESISSYNIGEMVDGYRTTKNIFFMSIDMNAKYHFTNLFKKHSWFDPYLSAGLGGTLRTKFFVPTLHPGGGVNFWITDRFAANLQSFAKFSLSSNGSKYFQHSLGVKFLL